MFLGAMLGGACPNDSKCLPGTSMAEVKAHIANVGQSKGVRYVTKLVSRETDERSVLFLIDESGSSVAWLMSKEGCQVAFIKNGLPAETVALVVFGKPFKDIFPPEMNS